ncbi:wax ester/triacylglycerol synthase family O-acyltransferase [[Mycobacterium] zoologicum]|uniref:wax ester/triacylglycerol synthase family O-acyltransferase n=1 Tax=[Mycobacterium] zoologicum TaxID=2872311 RepID=UPI002D0DFE36|nr:wax ester/triacylglycerol synthase family O-acyltransferase [Mycolicibacter sp. MYC101]MEB3065056.1 wax ester/triacylglycerol synthase family O-acyltransferase [Mycolicibacter sp. MYC101]
MKSQLSVVDSAFVHLESISPWNGGVVLIYDRSTAQGEVTFDDLLKHFKERLHLVDALRIKLARVPGNLDRPYWAEDPRIDLEYHMSHLALPPPGDWRAFCQLVSRLIVRPLDMARPLWELYMIDGLQGVEHCPENSFAVVLKAHHAVLDGGAYRAIMGILHSDQPNSTPPRSEQPGHVASSPSPVESLARAGLHSIQAPVVVARTLSKAGPGLSRMVLGKIGRRLGGGKRTPAPAVGRPERLTGRVGPHRSWGACFFDFADTKVIRDAVDGATVTDLGASVVAGALRRYLSDCGELPTESMKAAVLVGLRAEADSNLRFGTEQSSTVGNKLTAMFADLGTNIDDPIERLAAVRASTHGSKEGLSQVGATAPTALLELVPESLLASLSGLIGAVPGGLMGNLPMSTAVTGMPGPPGPHYLCGAKLVHLCGFGPVSDGMLLMNIIVGYQNELGLFFTADRDAMPDPWHYEDCLRQSFDDLHSAALSRRPSRTVKNNRKDSHDIT